VAVSDRKLVANDILLQSTPFKTFGSADVDRLVFNKNSAWAGPQRRGWAFVGLTLTVFLGLAYGLIIDVMVAYHKMCQQEVKRIGGTSLKPRENCPIGIGAWHQHPPMLGTYTAKSTECTT